MLGYVMCVSRSLGKSLLELMISARETWHGHGRSRQRNAFPCSSQWANTFSRKENDLRCKKTKTLTNVQSDETFCLTAIQTVDEWAVAESPASNWLGYISLTSSSFIYFTHSLSLAFSLLSFLLYLSIFHSHAPFCHQKQLSRSVLQDPDAENCGR